MKPEVENGNLSVDKDQYVEPENVTIQCDSGYGIVGTQIITCSEDRTWYPKVLKCEWVSGTEFGMFYQILKTVVCSRVSQLTLMRSDFNQDPLLTCSSDFWNKRVHTKSTW